MTICLTAVDTLPAACDALLVVYHEPSDLTTPRLAALINKSSFMDELARVDHTLHKQVHLLPHQSATRLILAPTGPLGRDYDDVRRFAEAARKAIVRARSAGSRRPALVVSCQQPPAYVDYSRRMEVAVLGALQELHESIEVREWKARIQSGSAAEKSAIITELFVLVSNDDDNNHHKNDIQAVSLVGHIEQGRHVARDIISGDPERMAPSRIVDYLEQAFRDLPNLRLHIQRDRQTLQSEYPLLSAVARASFGGASIHWPAVVKIEYRSPDQSAVRNHLFLTGKGITYDTGGADLKVNGSMRGMSRDKGGAAAVAGFLRTIAAQQPRHLNVSASLALVRNSIGPDSYVSDEIIVARSGKRVLVGNTDAEGRMVMADLLCEQKEQALALISSGKCRADQIRLFTCATLTGHVIRAYGPYPACLDNGPARLLRTSEQISVAGELFGEPWERSSLRREDYAMVEATSDREDVVQCNTAPSTMTARGHQFPAAFMAVAAGLDSYGLEDGGKRLAYTHMDIAGAAEEDGPHSGSFTKTTGAPVISLSAAFLL